MALFDKTFDKIAKRSATKILTDLSTIQKADSQAMVTPVGKPGILRYTFDPVYVNNNYYNKKKPDSNISFDVLRNFSLKYEIVRACINLRKRQLAGMEWDIVTAETSQTDPIPADIEICKAFINNLGSIPDPRTGEMRGGNYRRWINMVIEDLLALDAVALYNVRSNKGDLMSLLPVDGSTIRLMVEGMGIPPAPPEIAFKQIIRGTVVAELTTDDLLYEMMNPRTNSPYGLSPLESLMITVSSALKSGLYNLAYLTDGNIPEGLVNAPALWNPTQIKEFEKNWNAALAGDDGATRKLHWLPADSKYTPTKKPDDMAFGSFNEWLLRLTCAVFDVMPIEIGFPDKNKGLGDKGANQSQKDTSEEKGLRPLANLVEEILNWAIQTKLGYTNLKFSYTGLDIKNLAEAAEINEQLIFSGQRTINEIRTDDGLEPVEGGDALFVIGGQATALNQFAINAFDNGIISNKLQPKQDPPVVSQPGATDMPPQGADKKPQMNDDDVTADNDQDINASKSDKMFIQLVTEMRTLRKYVRNSFKRGRELKPFTSKVLGESLTTEINNRLSKCVNLDEAEAVIREYRNDYQLDFIYKVNKLRERLAEEDAEAII